MLLATYGILLCFCVLIFNYVWCKRKFYYLSWNMKGPITLPFIGNAWMFLNSDDTMNIISRLGQIYGSPSRFWLGLKFAMYINTAEEMETVINAEIQDKGNVYDNVSDLIGGHGLLSLNGNAWKTHRKLLNPTVQHYNILNSFNPAFNKKISILINKLEERSDKETFNIYKYLEAAAADIVCNTTFGTDMKLQQNENETFLNAVNDGTFLAGLKTLQPWYQYKLIMKFSKYNEMNEKCTKTIKEFVKKIYDRKLIEYNNEASRDIVTPTDEFGIKRIRNFIDECIRLTFSQKSFNEEDSITESISMLLAGFETTTVTVANIILMLAIHPEYQDKIYDEIKNILPKDQKIVTSDVLKELHHTDRVFKETLRLFPTVPLITRITRNEMKIGGHDIPIGTDIVLSLFDLHRKPSVWGPNANKFDPNNFLPENVAARHSHSYIPFAFGTRNCIGENDFFNSFSKSICIGLRYANIVIRLIVASLVRNYTFTTDLNFDELKFKWAVTLKLENGHMVKISKRN